MARTLVVTCDWCLDTAALSDPVEVVVDGASLDLCRDHAVRWEALTGSAGGGFRPRAVSSDDGDTSAAAAETKTSSVASTRSVDFHVSKKSATRGASKTSKVRGSAVKAKEPRARKVAKKESTSRTSASQKLRSSVDSSAVRAWAQSNGIKVPARGPLKASLIEQFLDSPLNKKSKVPSAAFTSA